MMVDEFPDLIDLLADHLLRVSALAAGAARSSTLPPLLARDTPAFDMKAKASVQTKNTEAQTAVQAIVNEALKDFLEKHPQEAKAIVAKILLTAKARLAFSVFITGRAKASRVQLSARKWRPLGGSLMKRTARWAGFSL